MEQREIGGIGFVAGRWPLDQGKATLVFIHGADQVTQMDVTVRDGETTIVSARPSDAIAIASRMEGVPLLGAEEVLEAAGLEIDEDEVEGGSSEDPDEEVRRFREFLDTVHPDDFEQG